MIARQGGKAASREDRTAWTPTVVDGRDCGWNGLFLFCAIALLREIRGARRRGNDLTPRRRRKKRGSTRRHANCRLLELLSGIALFFFCASDARSFGFNGAGMIARQGGKAPSREDRTAWTPTVVDGRDCGWNGLFLFLRDCAFA